MITNIGLKRMQEVIDDLGLDFDVRDGNA